LLAKEEGRGKGESNVGGTLLKERRGTRGR
jgi:hypothetical protein